MLRLLTMIRTQRQILINRRPLQVLGRLFRIEPRHNIRRHHLRIECGYQLETSLIRLAEVLARKLILLRHFLDALLHPFDRGITRIIRILQRLLIALRFPVKAIIHVATLESNRLAAQGVATGLTV